MGNIGRAIWAMLLAMAASGFAFAAESGPEQLNAQELFTEDDYPSEALRLELQGRTEVRLTINANGRVQACQVIQSSGHDVLDQATCHIYQTRAEFRPARNREGRAVAGKIERRIVWRLPMENPGSFQPRVYRTEFLLHADRSVSDCMNRLLIAGQEQAQRCETAIFAGPGLFSILSRAGFSGEVDVLGIIAVMRMEADLEGPLVAEAGWTPLVRQDAALSVNDEGTTQDCEMTQPLGSTSANLPLCSFADSLSTKPLASDDGGSGARRISVGFMIFARQHQD